MRRSSRTAEKLQSEYFTARAKTYHQSVVRSDDEHGRALLHISTFIDALTRVARKAVFISDSNRFGGGSLPTRLIKYGVWQMGLWPMMNFIRTRGKGYTISEGDGVAYSYSVFDNYKQLAEWADLVIVIPTSQNRRTRHHMANPTLTSSHVLLCAIRN
ncbi:MAG: hypothetical protein WBV94_04675 [Blastocatellia bacterium]